MSEMHQVRFPLQGSAPDPAGWTYSAPPDHIAVFTGAFFWGEGDRKGTGREGEGNRRGGVRREGKRRGGRRRWEHSSIGIFESRRLCLPVKQSIIWLLTQQSVHKVPALIMNLQSTYTSVSLPGRHELKHAVSEHCTTSASWTWGSRGLGNKLRVTVTVCTSG